MENQNTITMQQILGQILPFIKDFFIQAYGEDSKQYASLLELENNQQSTEDMIKNGLEVISRFQMIDLVEYMLNHKKEYAIAVIKGINIIGEIIPARSIRKEFEKAISGSETTIDTHKNINTSILGIIISIAGISLSDNYRLKVCMALIVAWSLYSLVTNRFIIQKHKYYISFVEHLQDAINDGDIETIKSIFKILHKIAPKQEQKTKIKADIFIKYMQGKTKAMYQNLMCENKYLIILTIIYIIGAIVYKHYFI